MRAPPLKVEAGISPDQAKQQIRRYSARMLPDKSTDDRRIFYSGSARVWIQLTSDGREYRLEYYASCPC